MRIAALLAAVCAAAFAADFKPSATSVDVYDYVEVAVTPARPVQGNPFLSGSVDGTLTDPSGRPVHVSGFADAIDGSMYRIRFMPVREGLHRFSVKFAAPGEEAVFEGKFTAAAKGRKGLVRIDPKHPFHFTWEGTGEPFFWNGLTTYALLGWEDEARIRAIIDRAATYKVNRLRVTLVGPRVKDASRWDEPVRPSGDFRFLFGPWVAARPDNIADPGWDVTRFNPAFWQKCERTLRHARERDVTISIIFLLDGADPGADPFGKANRYSEDHKRYYRYAAARLSAFSNVMWDVTNEWHLFRDAWWVEQMGQILEQSDPYDHLKSCHGRGDFPWMLSSWADFAMFQMWDEGGGYEAMLKRRQSQGGTGRPMPQINEEYGYEDHYPVRWGNNLRPPSRNADSRRRLAWDITMAGSYQTTGERANRGDGRPPATPGGWVNGGFDDSMTMLVGYRHMVNFFTSFDYRSLEPAPESVRAGKTRVLAEPGRRYVVYLPQGGAGSVELAAGRYRSRWFNPRTGAWTAGPAMEGGVLSVLPPEDEGDWALLIERE